MANAPWYLPGQTVTVNIRMTGASAVITGGQFFMSYDQNKLDFVSISPGGDPFVREIFEVVNESTGTIDYAVGVLEGNPGTMSDSNLATVTFNALAETCATANMVTFRAHTPPTRLTDSDGAAVTPSLVNLGSITIDGTSPIINCPTNRTVSCDADNTPAATGMATSTDNCDATPTVTSSDVITPGACTGDFTITRTWRSEDDGGNARTCNQTITVRDTTQPSLTCPSDITTDSESGECTATLDPGAATALDNCDGAPTVVGTREDGLPLVGDYISGTTSITWEVTDCSGNSRSCVQSITVTDTEMPVITCPANISVNADAGGTNAFVNVPAPTGLEDNCGIASVVNNKTGTANASGVYPAGPTTVTWTVTDVFGNQTQCTHTVTVSAFNEMKVSIQFSPTVQAAMTRCITFTLYNCATGTPVVVEQPITFGFGLALEVPLLVPAGSYGCITARDRLHTLRRTDEGFQIVGTQYVADFTGNPSTGGDWLVGGNLNDDQYVDILDFGMLSQQWNTNYGGGSTNCATASPHADVSGNGNVTLGDFTFIQINFLKNAEPNCCGLRSDLAEDRGPIAEIAVSDLAGLGLEDLADADYNHDGVLNSLDIAAFFETAGNP